VSVPGSRRSNVLTYLERRGSGRLTGEAGVLVGEVLGRHELVLVGHELVLVVVIVGHELIFVGEVLGRHELVLVPCWS